MSGAVLLTTHSVVAILTVGDLASRVGSAAGLSPYRRANLLDVTVCTYPFLLPYFLPPILTSSATAAATGSPFMAGDLTTAPAPTIRAGVYAYNTTTQQFEVSYPATPGTGRSWTAIEVTVNASHTTWFAKIWGISSLPSGARAVAVYRPRDVAFVLDMTGSMAYASTFNYNNVHHNADPLVPTFGHYVGTQSNLIASANATNANGEAISRNNYTMTTPGGPPIARNFYYDPSNASNPAASTTLPADRTVLKNAFHYGPPETAGDPTNYVSQTYDFSGYDAFSPRDAANPKGPTPAPGSFGSQTDGGGITYVGDRYRRADGSINKADATWATGAASTRGAGTAIELLGYKVVAGIVQTSNGTPIVADSKFRDPTWEANGYDLDVVAYRTARGTGTVPAATASPPLVPAADRFVGYSMGPGYWGKTFFIWPPDPRTPAGNPGDAGYQPGDWRQRYFTVNGGASGSFNTQGDNNTANGSGAGNVDTIAEQLFNTGSGMTLRTGTGNFGVDYARILKWIKSGPQTLPPNLRAGRVLYYSSIPNDVDTATGTTDEKADKRFWKEYIDYVVGFRYTSAGYLAGNGDSWASAPRVLTAGDLATWTGPTAGWAALRPYMRYTDSPNRPRLHFWFGPLSMLDFIGNIGAGNANPGTCNESQCWQLKAGMNSVLDDIRNNHPNDAVGMVMFAYAGYRDIRVPMGQDFTALKNALFFPKSLLTAINGGDQTSEVRPNDVNWTAVSQDEIPNANGSTDPNTGLMYAYNLLSPSTSLPAQYGTVRGRRGASKIVIFETDGVPNSYSTGTFNPAGYNSYYSNIVNGGSPGNGVEPSMSNAVAVASRITSAMATGTSGTSGLSLPNAPARVYPIAFGDLFDATLAPSATFRVTAQQFMANLGVAGGTLPAGSTSLPSYLTITGTYQNRIDTLKTGLERIFQSGVSVSLIE